MQYVLLVVNPLNQQISKIDYLKGQYSWFLAFSVASCLDSMYLEAFLIGPKNILTLLTL
jgi:hypothetical protein